MRLFRIGALVVALCVVCAGGAWIWLKWKYAIPSEQVVQQHFVSHKAEFIELASLLKNDNEVLGKYIGNDGTVAIDSTHSRSVPDYSDRIRRIGAKFILVREDGSMEFALRGFGCPLCSDSYMGVRYFPNVRKSNSHSGWEPQVVGSLESAKLAQENGSVASGLYVVPIEHEWFIYRLEIQE